MNRTWRRILTAKAIALSVLFVVAFVVAAIAHRRHLDAARTAGQRRTRRTSGLVGENSGAGPVRNTFVTCVPLLLEPLRELCPVAGRKLRQREMDADMPRSILSEFLGNRPGGRWWFGIIDEIGSIGSPGFVLFAGK